MCSRGPSLSYTAEFYGSTEGLLHIGPGCIIWLPKGYRPRPGSTLREPPEGAFGHPILVLSVTVTDAKNAIISFATLTSFTKERWNSRTDIIDISKPGFEDRYVKILPFFLEKKTTTITPPPLTLEHRQERKSHLRQTSFVDLSAVYSAQLADLCVYDVKLGPKASLFRLNKDSFKHVWGRICGEVSGVGMGAPWTWVPTEQLRNDFAKCAIRVRDNALKASATTMASASSRIDHLMCLLRRLPRTIDWVVVAPSSQLGGLPRPCSIGGGASWTWVPTQQLRNDFAKCTIQARYDALKEFATTMASARNRIDRLMLLILRLPRTIDSIGAAPYSQLGVSPHHLLLHCAGLAAALATLEETTTTCTHTFAATCMLYAAIIMISRRLSPLPTRRPPVRLGQGAQKHRLVSLVGAEVMGDAALLAGIVFVGFAAKKSAEARDSPVQAATGSMAAGMSGLEGQDGGGWTTVSYPKRRR